ncbi:MAG: 6-carboxytetrahydropterin synthase [bacterium]|nr:6-carboxytetrahydropterin synthase [bacterium]
MYRVTKSISFCYGHRLLDYPGKCGHLHGHNARAIIILEGENLDELGMLVDFNEIKNHVKHWVDNEIDHTMLLHRRDPMIPLLQHAGERFYVTEENPTAEHIAKMIFDHVLEADYPVIEVTVTETDSCYASYRLVDTTK